MLLSDPWCTYSCQLQKKNTIPSSICRWAANQTLGLPNVYPKYGDYDEAWAARTANNHEWIEVSQVYYLLIHYVCMGCNKYEHVLVNL